MTTKGWITVIVILALLIAALAWLDLTTPAPNQPSEHAATSTQPTQATSTGAVATSTGPLSTQVTVSKPAANATVKHSFEVSGIAPGGWYFEAVFPIQVRDANDDLIGSAQGRAQSDWTQPGPIAFTAQISIDANYHGPATLILLKDNPSGNPENADEITVPIVIQ